jgi:hypothetical protein
MPASNKMLRNRQQKANVAAGIGDESGRIVRTKDANVMAKCTICQHELRMTKANVEALQHSQSKHPTSTFETCFPGQTYVDKNAASPAQAGGKLDLDKVRAQAREARNVAEGGVPKAEKKKKKKEDLSFLDASL